MIKIECRNHLLRNYSNKLAVLTKNTKYPISVRNFIKSNPMRFRCAITKAIEYRNSLEDQTQHQKIIGKLYNFKPFSFNYFCIRYIYYINFRTKL